MNLLLDASSLNFKLAGIGNYSFNLVRGLEKYYPNDKIKYLFQSKNVEDQNVCEFIKKNQNRVFYYSKSGKITNSFLNRLGRFVNKKKIENKFEVYHGQDLLFHLFPKKRNTLTIHDLTTEMFPEFHDQGNVIRNKMKLDFADKHCSLVIVVSEHTKKDLIKFNSNFKNRIRVVYQTTNPIFDDLEFLKLKNREFLKNYLPEEKINKPYLLSVSTIEPRKNFSQVLRVFQELKSKGEYKNLILILVGVKGWENEKYYEDLKKHHFQNDIFHTGYAPLSDLPLFYSNAECFLYLSFYEGFGIPILESMKSGCPVIASNNSSIPEITGDIDFLVNPNDTEEIVGKIEHIFHSSDLRNSLIKNGLKRAELFTLEKMTRGHWDVYQELMK